VARALRLQVFFEAIVFPSLALQLDWKGNSFFAWLDLNATSESDSVDIA
jgi:hypothetical protein